MAYHEFTELWKHLLKTGLSEDGWEWDWTTLGTLKSPDQEVVAQIIAKSDGVWAGAALLPALESVSAELGGAIQAKILVKNGQKVKMGTVLTEWRGPARVLLALERPFLNVAAYVSGIATRTRALVDEVEWAWKNESRGKGDGPAPRVTLTRKTLPHYRDVAIYAVRAGGGFAHRVSLSGGVLIKENHIAAAGGIKKAVAGARAVAPHGLKVEIEVTSLAELKEAIAAKADVIMLDNFEPNEVFEATELIKKLGATGVTVEVSGGLNESNISDYVMNGIHILSVGSLTHSVHAMDLSLLVK